MIPQRALVFVAALLFAGCGCSVVPGEGDLRVSGWLVDAETGESVSREDIYIHAYDDTTGEQLTLEHSKSSEFAFDTESSVVRFLIVDKGHKYKKYERVYDLQKDGVELEAALQPTHFVRVSGRVLVGSSKEQLRPIRSSPELGATPFVHLGDERLKLDSSGRYSTRLDRELHRVQRLNFGGEVHPTELDLRGCEKDEFQFDVTLRNIGYSE